MNKPGTPVIIWLFTGLLLIAGMVVVGGITRLTNSGLSMVEWKLLIGSIPPLNKEQWMEIFNKYKQTPEFQLINYDFTLSEFKSIFWWEYTHRLIGRMLGLIFLVPFVYFLVKRKLEKNLVKKLVIIFILGGFQGILGWYMVKSGLVNIPDVSHYRLAAHLAAAFVLYAFLLKIILEIIFPVKTMTLNNTVRRLTISLLILLFIQVIYGAFVSGLDAGKIYNTFPKMGGEWIAGSVDFAFKKDGITSFTENLASVQFIHRALGIVIFLMVVIIFVKALRGRYPKPVKRGAVILLEIVLLQVLLGIFSLLYAVPIALGALHQLGALLLFSATLFFEVQLRRKRIKDKETQ